VFARILMGHTAQPAADAFVIPVKRQQGPFKFGAIAMDQRPRKVKKTSRILDLIMASFPYPACQINR
jgi:hypothetical protein